MSIKTVYYEPFNSQKSKELYELAIHSIETGKENSLYYILPNGELLKKYRKKIIDELGGFLEFNLFTFDDVVREILKHENYIEIDEHIKLVIMRKIIRGLDLNFFKKVDDLEGFIKTISNIIGHIKRSLITPNAFIEKAPSNEMYREVGLIYSHYQEYLRNKKLADREGLYLLAIEKLEENQDFFLGIEKIIIDEFYDFRPIELEILKEISKKNIDIHINIPFKKKDELEILKDTFASLKNLGFTLKNKSMVNDSSKLEEVMFIEADDEILEEGLNISIITSPTKELEVKKVFQKIKENLKLGIEYEDIFILPIDDQYRQLVEEMSLIEKLPISKDISINMIDNDLIMEIMDIILMKIDNSKQGILNRVNSKYLIRNLEDVEKEKQYVFLKELDFKNLEDLLHKLESKTEFDTEAKNLEALFLFLEDIGEDLDDLQEIGTIKEYNDYILNRLKKYKVEKSIYKILNYSEDKFYEYMKVLNGLNQIFKDIDKFSNLINKLSIEEYFDLLSSKLEGIKIPLIDGKAKGIQVINLIDARGVDYKVGFVVGLAENNYPNIEEENFFINEKNYKTLKSMGIDVKNYRYKLENEIMKFSSLISTIENSIYFSYSKGIENESIPSIFLDEIERLMGENINYIDVSFDYIIKNKIEDLTTKEDLSQYILSKYYQGEEIDEGYINYHNEIYPNRFKNVKNKIVPEFNRSKKILDKYSGNLREDESIVNEIVSMNANNTYSSSYLEQYNNCPYSFLMERVLNVEEYIKDIKEYDPMVIGNIYHNVLKDFYEKNKNSIERFIINKESFSLEENKEYLEELVLKYSKEYEIKIEAKKDKLLIENIKSNIYNFILADLDRIKKHNLIPDRFEEEFGYGKKVVIKKDDKSIFLVGKIDRIDRTLDDKVIVIDYKSSSPKNSNLQSILEGKSLQIPIYLISQINNNPVAGVFAIINSAEAQVSIGVLGETSVVNNRHRGKLESVEELNKVLNNTKDIIFKIDESIAMGDFSIRPKECPDYCLYKDICRYKQEVEV